MFHVKRKESKVKKVVEKSFVINVKLIPNGEIIRVKNVIHDTTISKIRNHVKTGTGIPTSIMRMFYFDRGDLHGTTDLRDNDVIQGSQLQCDVWDIWRPLVTAALNGEHQTYRLEKLGLKKGTRYPWPAFDYMGEGEQAAWLAKRASVALFIATSRLSTKLCTSLLNMGANVNARNEDQRTPLIVAASKGCLPLIDLFLLRGAKMDAEDSAGATALKLASKHGYRECEKRLFLYYWQQHRSTLRPRYHCH
ncbi:hypothetical protein LSAT2_025456 [Lamellibrachia satsuma]|nr:hypothetical protein LSAT2_025456 [Lamellibrachia satsuma]